MWVLWSTALAGHVYVLDEDPEGVAFRVVDATGAAGSLVTWPGRPIEVVVVADLSGSIVADEHGATWSAVDGLLALHAALRERAVAGDRLGVTVFAGGWDRWIPLGPLDRPGLDDWLAAFGPPPGYASADGFAGPTGCRSLARGRAWSVVPGPPARCALLEDRGTDVTGAIEAATDELRARPGHGLKVVVVLWDGGQNVASPLRRALDRAWAAEVHVWSVGLGEVVPSGLVARGGGDAYLAGGRADLVMRRIVDQLRVR